MSRFHFGRRRKPAPLPCPSPRNTVLHGDCIAVMATLPAASVDLVLTDPPYVCRYRDRSGRTVANDDRTDWLAPAFAGVARLMKPGAFCVSFYGWQHAESFLSAWREAGLRPVGHLVFPKPYSSSRQLFEARHEQAYVLAKGAWQRVGEQIPDVLPWRYTGNRLHPTQKPLVAIEPIVTALSKPGQMVFDPFAGSGSSLVAAQALGRDYLGIELDPEHVRTAEKRLERG